MHGISCRYTSSPPTKMRTSGADRILLLNHAVVRRCPNGLGLPGGTYNADGDANPVAMIYDFLVLPPAENGLELPQGFLDLDAFRGVGQTLATEGLGLSMLQDRKTSARDLAAQSISLDADFS